MKKISYLKTKLIVSIIIIQFFASCGQDSNKDESITKVQKHSEAESCLPIKENEKVILINSGETNITLVNGAQLSKIRTKIRLSDFLNYMSSQTAQDPDALRIYPSFTGSNNLHTIFAKTTYPDKTEIKEDKKMIRLELSDYTLNGVNLPAPTDDILLMRPYVQKYFEHILIENNPQTAPKYTKSRIFKWSEINQFLSDNIDGFDTQKPNAYNNYSLLIEIGYIDELHSANFIGRMEGLRTKPEWVDSLNKFQGITFIITLIDPTGKEMIGNMEDSVKYYKNKALEVAHPCPPLCGSLYSN